MGLKYTYDIKSLLESTTGYKAQEFPVEAGGIEQPGEEGKPKYQYTPYPHGPMKKEPGKVNTTAPERQEFVLGTRLFKQNHLGIWYFMPVFIKHKDITSPSASAEEGESYQNTIELPNATMSITGKKTIVETPMVGRKGTVKELISIVDYTVKITAFVHSTDGTYPYQEIEQIKQLFNINESVELISVLTDLVFDNEDRVVINKIEFVESPGIEDGQIIKIDCVTDKDFELIIKDNDEDALQ